VALPRLQRSFDVYGTIPCVMCDTDHLSNKSRDTRCVLANGTTRLQVDITKSSGLRFDMLFSSELLGMTKVCMPSILGTCNHPPTHTIRQPDPAIYRRAMQLLRKEPRECMMVAAHAYDLRAAKQV